MIVKKTKKQRPKNLNLLTIRFPVNALVSILHRSSGVLMFVLLPWLLWLLQLSLQNADGYRRVQSCVQGWPVKLLLTVLAWAALHHFFAGLRHLAMDMHWMQSLQKARFSSRLVLLLVALGMLCALPLIW